MYTTPLEPIFFGYTTCPSAPWEKNSNFFEIKWRSCVRLNQRRWPNALCTSTKMRAAAMFRLRVIISRMQEWLIGRFMEYCTGMSFAEQLFKKNGDLRWVLHSVLNFATQSVVCLRRTLHFQTAQQLQSSIFHYQLMSA